MESHRELASQLRADWRMMIGGALDSGNELESGCSALKPADAPSRLPSSTTALDSDRPSCDLTSLHFTIAPASRCCRCCCSSASQLPSTISPRPQRLASHLRAHVRRPSVPRLPSAALAALHSRSTSRLDLDTRIPACSPTPRRRHPIAELHLTTIAGITRSFYSVACAVPHTALSSKLSVSSTRARLSHLSLRHLHTSPRRPSTSRMLRSDSEHTQ